MTVIQIRLGGAEGNEILTCAIAVVLIGLLALAVGAGAALALSVLNAIHGWRA